MFGFARRRAIESRAKSLGDLLLLLVNSINSMPLADFIEANRRLGVVDSYIDMEKGEYGFFECEPEQAEFSFHVRYGSGSDGAPTLTVEGHRRCFGLILVGIGSPPPARITVDLSRVIAPNEFGQDTRALQTALLKFPGFHSHEQLMAHLRR